ncbi:Sec1 family domain-containing protein 1, partial [Stylophora pistillata]
VFDQYLNFISLEDEMFTVRNQDRDSISYYALNRPDAKDTDIEMLRDVLVDSLFSVLVSLDVFDRPLGTLPGEVHLEVDNNIKPVTTSTRRVPTALKDDLREELNRSVEKEILAPVEEPTPWGIDEGNEEAISEFMADSTAKLTSALSSLPELLEK